VLTGAAPKRSRAQATGTKALILDVLSDGEARKATAIAELCQVKKTGGFNTHLLQLVSTGDVVREGRGRRTTYRVK
jgi:hypothetical protein